MRIVVDTNIIFSAVLNVNSKIASILLRPRTGFNFYSTEQLLFELNEHKDKLLKLSKYTEQDLEKVIRLLSQRIRFINIRLIPNKIIQEAEAIATGVDIDDTEFIALTNHITGKLWTGDMELINGLRDKNWLNFITTTELYKHLK